jgi:site-specific recombinase XerD
MAKSHLHLVLPAIEKPTVVSNNPAGRLDNVDYRDREHLFASEVERLIEAAKDNRNGHRDATMIRMAYRHGLRAKELVELAWTQINLDEGVITVKRAKGGRTGDHPLLGDEMRALRRLRREHPHSQWVFVSERGDPFTTDGFAAMVRRVAAKAELPIKVHPHMLRHACGYKLANDGKDLHSLQGYLGHKNVQNTVRYTALAPNRFKDFWRD